MSFLVSTPETGDDSVLITYGLLGPVMAVVRPLAAIATAIGAGLLSLAAGGRDDGPEDGIAADATPAESLRRPARRERRPADEDGAAGRRPEGRGPRGSRATRS